MKTKILNGLSYNLAQSFFSTLCYYDKGYMSDWIVNAANDYGIKKVEIDIINNHVLPEKLNIRPLIVHLENLRQIIYKTLASNKIDKEFIIEAKFIISINEKRELICENYVRGENKKIYKSKDYLENSFNNFKID